jgi:hypothetical protein
MRLPSASCQASRGSRLLAFPLAFPTMKSMCGCLLRATIVNRATDFFLFLLSKQRYFYEGNWAGVEQPANESQQPEDPSDAFPDAADDVQEDLASADEEVIMGVVVCQGPATYTLWSTHR